MNKILTLMVLLLSGAACHAQLAGGNSGGAEPHQPLSAHEIANATYSGIEDEPVTLVDGQWRGEPFVAGGASAPAVGLVSDFSLTGDLDGDEGQETLVLLWSSSGGSGTFDYIAVLERDANGALQNLATAPLGDRVRVMSAAIRDGTVQFDVVQAGSGDAACCPGQKVRRTFVLESGELMEKGNENKGRLSLADLGGEWVLTHFQDGEEVTGDIEITLAFEGNRIAGKSACNRYSGNVSAGEMPGDIALDGPMAMTRMMCPPLQMDAERRYIQALEKVTRYSFLAGKLVLSWSGDDGSGSLTFVSSAQPAPGNNRG
jgi:heat shock protein HslJ